MILALTLLLGCGWGEPTCSGPEQVLAPGPPPLTCHQTQLAQRRLAVLAGRQLPAGVADSVQRTLRTSWGSDPAGTQALMARLDQRLAPVRQAPPARRGVARSQALWAALHDEDALSSALQRAAMPWASEEPLVLSEVDIEGWLFYASLCHEAVGGEPLRLSVADRVGLYDLAKTRFAHGSTAEREALVSVGPYWSDVQQRWRAATYEQQQRWIAAAPLPPLSEGEPADYVRAVLEGDLVAHAAALHAELQPTWEIAP